MSKETETRAATPEELKRLREIERAVYDMFNDQQVTPSEAMTVVLAIACRLALASNCDRDMFLESVRDSLAFYASDAGFSGLANEENN